MCECNKKIKARVHDLKAANACIMNDMMMILWVGLFYIPEKICFNINKGMFCHYLDESREHCSPEILLSGAFYRYP